MEPSFLSAHLPLARLFVVFTATRAYPYIPFPFHCGLPPQGIENNTLMTPFEVLREELPGAQSWGRGFRGGGQGQGAEEGNCVVWKMRRCV